MEKDGITEQGIPLDVGSAIHELGEQQIKDAIEGKIQSDELADNIVDALPSIRPDIQPQAIKAARFLANEIIDMRIWDIIGVEKQVDDACKTGITTMTGRPYKLTACLDVLLSGRNSLHVFDWKSGFKKHTREETFNDFQAQFDTTILWQQYDGSNGDRIDTIHWWFIETFWGTKSYARFERNAEYPTLPRLTQEMQFKGRIFEAIKLWANKNKDAWPEEKKCSWCPIVLDCPHCDTSTKELAKDPKAFIDRIVVLEAALKKAKGLAGNWLKEYGPVKGSEMVFDWRQSTKFTPRLYNRNDNGQ